jgi:RHS repeat-associated protein
VLTVRSSNANGVSVDYAYDELNRLKTVKDNRILLNGGVTTYNYDPVGNLDSYLYPNGVTTSYNYNSLNRLTSMNTAAGATTQSSYSYTLGPAGNRTAVSELGGRTVTYIYDDLYRLKSETIANDPHGINGAVSYDYDPVGNRLSRTSTVTGVPAQSSTFDANDRLNSDSYDANGNTTSSNSNTYAYDFENRLTSLNNGAATFVYDGDGNRVSKTVSGLTTNYLVDTNNHTGYAQVVEELQSGSVTKQFTYGHDLISQRIIGGPLSFYSYDGHGSVRQLTDASASITDTYTYDAFGILIDRTGATPNDYLYTGEQFDADLGFQYLRARYLSSANGRFITMDSFEGTSADPRSLHKYLYAEANPANNVDPSGLFVSLAETSIANSLQSVLANINANIGFAVLEQLRYGGNAGFKSLAFAGLLSIGSFALRPAIRAIGGIIGGGQATTPLRFSQISCRPFFSANGTFAGMSIGQVVKGLRSGEISMAQVPVRYILRKGVKLIVNTRSSLALIRARIPEDQWNLIQVQTLENGDDIAVRLAANGLDESGTDVIRVGELYGDPNLSILEP